MASPRIPSTSGKPILEAIGESEAFLAFQEELSLVAKVDRPLLIIGERGTGKELAAARLHYLSQRWNEPLIALNCAALPPSLIESELFGYEAGAFTGAGKKREGRFEAADKGTLFLDEIGNIPLEVQAKVLRAVEYQTFERVGSSMAIQVDVRIIGATNADLPRMAKEGTFQQDLLDRLAFEVLHVPPLRDRHGDVTILASYFSARMAHELGRSGVPRFSDDALEALEKYHWPGNVRELKNVVERAVYRSQSDLIDEIAFNPFPSSTGGRTTGESVSDNVDIETPAEQPSHDEVCEDETETDAISLETPLPEQVADLEIRLIKKALRETRYNQKLAAERLGLTYHQFRGLFRKHGGKDVFG